MNEFEKTLDRVANTEGDSEFDLIVSEDKLEAYIRPKGDVLSEVTLDDIKKILEIEGIKYDIVDDILITEYLATKSMEEKPWKIAEGKIPGPGQDAKIKYYFDTAPLKIGAFNDVGGIDYKDRGKIPQVKKEALIAEKILATDGTLGIDIYGQPIPFPAPRDIKLLCGKGTEKSEDGLKVFAKINGRPEVLSDGKICVSPDLQISGDVGLETGHIDFDGDIKVHGSIQNGFHVRGGNLQAKEILKAEIDIEGDIVVSEGIMGASIKAGGKLRARHINNARIEVASDIDVEKEIYDSKIETNGECNIKRGNIMFSSIAAMKGIRASEIGSALSSPCTLLVGVDNMTKYEIKKINDHITEKIEVQNRLKPLVDNLQQEFDNLDKELQDIPQEEDRARLQQMSLKNKMEELCEVNDTSQIAKVKQAIEYLDSKIDQVGETMEKLIDEQDQVFEEITTHKNEIKNSEKEVEELHDEIKDLTELPQDKKEIPAIQVSGIIFANTSITGIHSSLITENDYQHVIIKETKITEPDSSVNWHMKISRLSS